MFDRKLFKNFDYSTLIIVFLLVAVGLVMISSATYSIGGDADKYIFLKKQVVSLLIGIILMIITMSIDYNVIGNFYWYIYGFNILILLSVKFFGIEVNGGKSWIQLGGFSIQPSEFSKVLIVLFVAKVIFEITKDYSKDISKFLNVCIVLGLSAIPLLLILWQPDFGTAMVVVAIIAVMLFAAKLSYAYFWSAAAFIGVLSPILWFYRLEEYQKDRIRVFLDPEADPLNRGFQVIQSKIAIGSGEFWGKGLFQGTQTQMGFLPFKETDFIFSVIGEELGFIWCIAILLLYGVLLLKLIDTARNSKDSFGALIVTGVAVMIGIHVFQNIGMTIGLMPVTGIPLPFISAGGSSLMANMMAIGLVLNVSMRRQKITF